MSRARIPCTNLKLRSCVSKLNSSLLYCTIYIRHWPTNKCATCGFALPKPNGLWEHHGIWMLGITLQLRSLATFFPISIFLPTRMRTRHIPHRTIRSRAISLVLTSHGTSFTPNEPKRCGPFLQFRFLIYRLIASDSLMDYVLWINAVGEKEYKR